MSTLTHPPAAARPVRRAVLFGLLLGGGLLIFVFGSPFFAVFPSNKDPVFATGLAVSFGLVVLALRRSAHAAYVPAAYALFTAAAANLVLVLGPFNALMTAVEPFRLMAQDKLAQFLAVVPVILVLTWVARRDLSWLYVQRGRPRCWLPFGLVALVVCAGAAAAILLVAGLTPARVWAIAPWALAWAALNAVMEELWFRGLFLRPYAAAIGWRGTLLVTALVFGVSHMNATYFESAAGLVFGLGVIGLGLALAWAIRWADSLWGAVLLHIGMDLLILLPVAQSL